MFSIAIDGPAGAGKSTLSRRLAQKLGFVYADTGALYRAIGLFAVQNGVRPDDAAGVEALLPRVRLDIRLTDAGQRVLLDGTDVSDKIRTPEISKAASQVSAVPAVRTFLLGLQRALAEKRDIVMDGRDIGTVVLPHAQLKIFLTASSEDRARRRFEELRARGAAVVYEQVLRDVKERDAQDSGRAVAPLRAADDAVLLDTTGNTFERSLEQLCAIAKEHLG